MKKNIIILLAMVVMLCLTSCEKKPEHNVISAKVRGFDTLEEMEDYSKVIVKGIREDYEEPIIQTSNGHIVSGFTFSSFKITEVIKDTSGTLENGSTITILENEVYDKDNNIIYHTADYNMMVEGNEYLLFLGKSSTNNLEYYVSAGINYGTISLEDDKRAVQYKTVTGEKSKDFSAYTPIWDAAKEKYIE